MAKTYKDYNGEKSTAQLKAAGWTEAEIATLEQLLKVESERRKAAEKAADIALFHDVYHYFLIFSDSYSLHNCSD